PETSAMPVALFSASHELPATAARHQVWGYLPKPFGLHELDRILERALGPPDGGRRLTEAREVEAEVRTAFREYRNLLASLNNYITLIRKADGTTPDAREMLA